MLCTMAAQRGMRRPPWLRSASLAWCSDGRRSNECSRGHAKHVATHSVSHTVRVAPHPTASVRRQPPRKLQSGSHPARHCANHQGPRVGADARHSKREEAVAAQLSAQTAKPLVPEFRLPVLPPGSGQRMALWRSSAARHAATPPGCAAHHCYKAVMRGANLVRERATHAGRSTHAQPPAAAHHHCAATHAQLRGAPAPRSLPGMREEGRVCRAPVGGTCSTHCRMTAEPVSWQYTAPACCSPPNSIEGCVQRCGCGICREQMPSAAGTTLLTKPSGHSRVLPCAHIPVSVLQLARPCRAACNWQQHRRQLAHQSMRCRATTTPTIPNLQHPPPFLAPLCRSSPGVRGLPTGLAGGGAAVARSLDADVLNLSCATWHRHLSLLNLAAAPLCRQAGVEAGDRGIQVGVW